MEVMKPKNMSSKPSRREMIGMGMGKGEGR